VQRVQAWRARQKATKTVPSLQEPRVAQLVDRRIKSASLALQEMRRTQAKWAAPCIQSYKMRCESHDGTRTIAPLITDTRRRRRCRIHESQSRSSNN
jgi:hypothetical protein